jgi:hypothetical protein
MIVHEFSIRISLRDRLSFVYPVRMRFLCRRRSGGTGDQLPLASLFLFTRHPPPCDGRLPAASSAIFRLAAASDTNSNEDRNPLSPWQLRQSDVSRGLSMAR